MEIEQTASSKAIGCVECRQTGFLGRIGLYEMLEMTDDLKSIVTEQSDLRDLRKQSAQDGLLTLRHSGAKKVAEGITTIEEVLRVTPMVE